MQEGPLKDLVTALERSKAQIRARVEHPFHIVKNLFHHRKTRYKGLAKNTAQLFSLFALANLVIARNLLRSVHGSNPSCVWKIRAERHAYEPNSPKCAPTRFVI